MRETKKTTVRMRLMRLDFMGLSGENFFGNGPLMENGFEDFNRAGLLDVGDSQGWRTVGHSFDEKVSDVNPSGDSGEVCVADDRSDTVNGSAGHSELFEGHGLNWLEI